MRRLLVATLIAGAQAVAPSCREHRDARSPRVYVTNEDSGDVTVIDTKTDRVVATIPVGKRPRGVRVGRDGKRVFVAVSGAPKSGPGAPAVLVPPDPSADGIAVVDLERAVLERRLPSGRDPEAFALDPAGKRLVVSNEETAEASIVDLERGTVTRAISVGSEPEGVAVRPDGEVAYVTCEAEQKVSVISLDTLQKIAEFVTGARPRGVAFAPDGRKAFVTDEVGGTVTVVDAVLHRPLATIELDSGAAGDGGATRPRARPMGVVVAPDGHRVYVTTGRAGGIAVIDAGEHRLVATIEGVGPRPWGIGITPDGSKLYVANGPSDDVAVVDTRSNRVVTRLKAGRSPWGIAVDEG
jgi:YVTN family beta-propeller protein